MDNWQVAQNYIILFGGAGAIGAYYYFTSKQPNRTGSANVLGSKRSESDLRSRGGNGKKNRERSDSILSTASRSENNVKQRKPKSQPAKPKPVLQEPVQDTKPVKESDTSNSHFAEQMMQARKGADLTSSKRQEQRIKTVKPKAMPSSSTTSTPELDDTEAFPPFTQSVNGQDVSDMLEASAPGPSTLRITAASAPVKQKTIRQPKEQVVESQKARQNRKKAEQRKEQRLAEEQDRKQLEERQRRAAREARGEPAKNGLATSKAPQTSAWDAKPAVAQHEPAPLLDTFDAESTSSSNGGLTNSTTATSTTDGEHHQQQNWESMPEEAQLAAALERSDPEYGWTTVSAPKKTTNKKKLASDGNSSDIATPNKENGKPLGKTGFSALDVEA